MTMLTGERPIEPLRLPHASDGAVRALHDLGRPHAEDRQGAHESAEDEDGTAASEEGREVKAVRGRRVSLGIFAMRFCCALCGDVLCCDANQLRSVAVLCVSMLFHCAVCGVFLHYALLDVTLARIVRSANVFY